MPNFETILAGLKTAARLAFPGGVPASLRLAVGYGLVLAFVLLACWGALLLLSKIKTLWTQEFQPLFYDPARKRRRQRRQRFADHVEHEIRRLNSLEAWSEYRFTELEAEIEAEGRRRRGPWPFRRRETLRRERSLARALASSRERLIILEGDPGAGKSVALRYVAASMARRAMTARHLGSVVPIYVNLKLLDRPAGTPITQALIRSFVLKVLNRAGDRDIDAFLEEEFQRGMEAGTWLFLFDSFDEMSDILGATEVDGTIRAYADAIADFLHGMNRCRGIVASRHFRGPSQVGWPRFRILPLSAKRRTDLIRRAELEPAAERDLEGRLQASDIEFASLIDNPMFLGLLCEHVRAKRPFPTSAHHVFETFVRVRLERDADRLRKRFAIEAPDVRRVAEHLAFCMAAGGGVGLSPTRADLIRAAAALAIDLGPQPETAMDALLYVKLAKAESLHLMDETPSFTFAHRRFQEYFATCLVLREPDRVSPSMLLTDARWRETAVVMCQSQDASHLQPLLETATTILREAASRLPVASIEPAPAPPPPSASASLPPRQGQEQGQQHRSEIEDDEDDDEDYREPMPVAPFPWPRGMLHVLSLLQDGFSGRMELLPAQAREAARFLLEHASWRGTLSDRRWALEVAAILPADSFEKLVERGFRGDTPLRDIAYRQAARLRRLPPQIGMAIRSAVIDMLYGTPSRLIRERRVVEAHLARLDVTPGFSSLPGRLIAVRRIDMLLCVFAIAYAIGVPSLVSIGLALAFVMSLAMLWSPVPRPFHSMRSAVRLLVSAYIGAFLLFGLLKRRVSPELVMGMAIGMWAPLALLGAKYDRMQHPVLWPFAPLVLAAIAFRSASHKMRAIPLLHFLYAAIGAVLLLALAAGAIALIALNLRVTAALLLSFGAVCLACIAWNVLQLAREWRRCRRWIKSRPAPLDVAAFRALLSEFRSTMFKRRIVDFVRHAGLLRNTPDASLAIARMEAIVENDRREIPLDKQKVQEDERAFLESFRRRGLFFFTAWTGSGGDALSALALLREQVHDGQNIIEPADAPAPPAPAAAASNAVSA